MLQSIQYGSGPPTYIYSNNAVGANNPIFHVFASQMGGYDPRRENPNVQASAQKREKKEEKEGYLQEYYQKEYKVRDFLKWK